MFHCPLCQHAAHARTNRYITDTTKERYHQCQNVNCSATFLSSICLLLNALQMICFRYTSVS